MPATAAALSAEQVRQYREQGVVLLDRVVPPEHLALLRDECAVAMRSCDESMGAAGKPSDSINHPGSRYFIAQPSLERRQLFDFIYGPLLAEVCRTLLGPDVWVFWEQYVVKGPEKGMSFSWHQDSGYCSADSPHRPYLTCWVALDDMTVENGTVHVLPTPRSGIRARVEHIRDPESNDLIGYYGSDPGDPVLCAAGSIACFNSVVFHRSGWNRTPRMRRTYLIQYSGERIRRPDGSAHGRIERVLRGGELQPIPTGGGFGRYVD